VIIHSSLALGVLCGSHPSGCPAARPKVCDAAVALFTINGQANERGGACSSATTAAVQYLRNMKKAGVHSSGGCRLCLWHSGALRGLVLLLLALMVVSSERSCGYPFPMMQQAFVAPAARPPGLGSRDQGLQRWRTAGTPAAAAGRKLLLAPLVGPNGGHDSLRQSQRHSTESCSSRASCWSVEGPAPWTGGGRTNRQASSLVVSAAAAQGKE
ncbi:unnamed protein product, partial [Ectocarpus fasciculatus]